jgi:hypothetical protein
MLQGASREKVKQNARITGGAGGIRTPYLLTASQALSQLSYSPEAILKFSIKPIGIQEEPALDFS